MRKINKYREKAIRKEAKNCYKKDAKNIESDNFTWSNREKSNIGKINYLIGRQKIIFYFGCTDIFFAEFKINNVIVKNYFRITFCSDLMHNKDIKGYKFVCEGVKFLAFIVLLRIKSKQKVNGNWFYTPIIFKNPLKTDFSIKNILL